MEFDHYPGSIARDDKLEFEFISKGPKGKINKLVRFVPTNNPDIYNLSFGNPDEDGIIDDEAIDNNGDRDKIIATIGSIIDEFTSRYPDKFIFFSGSTPPRTRLFRMALSIHIEKLNKNFSIYGVLKDKNNLTRVPFEKNVNYFGFMVKKKRLTHYIDKY